MRKKVLGLTLALSMAAASLAGCGGGGTTEIATAAVGDTTTTAVAETIAAAAAAGDTVLKWAVWDTNLTTYYQPLIDEFETASPGVGIGTADLGSADYQTVLVTESTGSGSNFDVVTIRDAPGYATLVNKGVLEPLDDYIVKDSVDLSAYGGVTDQVVMNNKLYKLPFRSNFWMVFYNKDVFDSAGVAYLTNDMTFEQYDRLARSVTNATPDQEMYGTHYHTWHSAVQLFGILDGKNSIVDRTYDFLKPCYEMVLAEQDGGVCQDYATLKTSSLHYSGAFAQGNIAMMNMDVWYVPTLIDKLKSGEYGPEVADWGIVKYLHTEGVEPGTTFSAIVSLAIPTSAPNKDLAWEFLKYTCGPGGAEAVTKTGTFPAIQADAVVRAIFSLEGLPEDEGSTEALKTAKTYLEMLVHPKSAEIGIALNEAHDAIITGGDTIDKDIAQMNERVGAILAQ